MTDEKFVHLHCHSYYSLLDGLSSPEDLASCAKDLGFKSLAITDHGSCAGLFTFQNACKKYDIKPILGTEAYITDDRNIKDKNTKSYHIILLAKNKIGYKNLIKLSSLGFIEGLYYKPRIDFELLDKYKEGLIVSTACIGGEIPNYLGTNNEQKAKEIANRYKETFGDDFYFEIMHHVYQNDKEQESKEKNIAILMYKLAKQLGIKAICTNDVHYARKEDSEAHDVLLSIQTLDNIKNPKRFTFGSDDFYLKPTEQMFDIYRKSPELLSNTVEISEKIEKGLISTSLDLLPSFQVPPEFKNEEGYLKALVKDGMINKGLIKNPIYVDRIRYEMSVIIKCNYTKYFLILWDIINFAKNNNILVGPGRGSAVSSLTLYVLGITQLDPIKYDLLFERFLNPDRVSPPDVDVDFDYYRRNEVFDYIIRKYGQEFCSQIGTYNSLKARGVIRSVTKALDLGNDWETLQKKQKQNTGKKIEPTKNSLILADTISKTIPFKPDITIEKAMKKEVVFREYMDKYPCLLKNAITIEGTMSSAGVHPAGIIVCKTPVIDQIPLRVSKGVTCSQYDGPEVEKIGLLKFDLLALKTLTVVDRTLKMIKERYNKEIDIDNLEPNDQNVFKILNGLNTKMKNHGVFQFEAYGISKLLAAIHVDTFEDMIVANALYRPGPLQAGVHEMYCNYKHKRQKPEFLHPKMGEVLNKTYGIMIFQEDISRVAKELAGFTGGQADTLRKAIGKKIPELLKEQESLFIEGCKKNNISDDMARAIFKQIDYFGGYGFNRCLSGDTEILNIKNNKRYSLSYLEKQFSKVTGRINDHRNQNTIIDNLNIVVDSFKNGEIVQDVVDDVFKTGEQDLFEIEFDNKLKIKCTLDHKFYCSDGLPHTVKEIIEDKLEVICD